MSIRLPSLLPRVMLGFGLLAGLGPAQAAAPTTRMLDAGWQLRLAPGQAQAKDHPQAAQWVKAQVPGVVQTDLMAAGLMPDPFKGDNEAKVQWVGLSDWQYRTQFDVDADTLARQHVELVFEGLDTLAQVTLNGHKVLDADNMFRRWTVDAKPLLKRGANTLEITFRSPIEALRPWLAKQPYTLPGTYDSAFGDEPAGRNSSIYLRKAPYHFSWDWGPRLVTAGPWKPVALQAWDEARVDDLHVDQQRVDAEAAQLEAQLTVQATQGGTATVELQVLDPDGKPVTTFTQQRVLDPGRNRIDLPVRIAHPRRWFPAGYGAQDRYTFVARLTDAADDTQQARRVTGLRSVELRREKDQWGRGMEFVINGIPIFAKGANMIPLDSFSSRVTEATIRRTLQDARDANMNMVRIWGGGIYQSDRFYETADELGIMVWQDFMFGGGIPPYDRAFRENTRQEAIDQVMRLRDHPSIVLWCGNNEVQVGWEGMGDSAKLQASIDPAERSRIERGMDNLFGSVLRDVVTRYSPNVPYWATSPGTDLDTDANQTDDGDMHYWQVWGGPAYPVTQYMDVTPRFMSEYGLQSFPDMRTVRDFAGDGALSLETPAIKAHQKWDHGRGNARQLLYIRREFGEPKDFASLVYLSQLMQAEGIQIAAEHHRASRPRTMGTLFWQLNDVWPVISWSSVDYEGRWKALQYHARRFFAPELVAALRKDGQTHVALVSDRTTPLAARWRVRVMDFHGKLLSTDTHAVTLPALSSTQLGQLSDADLLKGADPKTSLAVFELLDGDTVLSRQSVYFDAAKHLELPIPQVAAQWQAEQGGYAVTLTSPVLARELWLSFGDIDATLSDNAFDLLPGTPATVHVRSSASLDTLRAGLQLRDVASTLQGAPPESEAAR